MTITDRFVGVVAAIRQAVTKWSGRSKPTPMPGNSAAGDPDDPVLAFLAQAPIDDEPVTADDERAIADGWDAHHRGESIAAADAKRQTLTPVGTERIVPV